MQPEPEGRPSEWRGLSARGSFVAGVVTGAAVMFALAVLVWRYWAGFRRANRSTTG